MSSLKEDVPFKLNVWQNFLELDDDDGAPFLIPEKGNRQHMTRMLGKAKDSFYFLEVGYKCVNSGGEKSPSGANAHKNWYWSHWAIGRSGGAAPVKFEGLKMKKSKRKKKR